MGLQEELEESGQTTIYDDYKFLTKEDIARLDLTKLVGTDDRIRAYMHGYFVDYKLYKKVKTCNLGTGKLEQQSLLSLSLKQ